MKILVLGAGLVGGPMAIDLATDPRFDVTVADINEQSLARLARAGNMQTIRADLSRESELKNLISPFDFIVNAVPGFMGFETFHRVIEAGKNIVDIAFFIEDPFQVDALAKERNVTAIMDCGVAPGMCNILIGYVDSLLDETENVLYMVGGLPEVREYPYEYKAVFSPIDVIEEYTRPARFIENGKEVIKPALSEPELINFPQIGTLEAFNTDGLRSLTHTIKALNMKEKTLRYPGHIQKMALLRDTGFFTTQPISIKGQMVRPIDLTAQLLFPKWKLNEREVDITVMRVIVEGKKDGHKVRYTYDLYDKLDPVSGVHSMARTTGYTATVALRMVVDGLYSYKGVTVPEFIGRDATCTKYMLDGLAARGIHYQETVTYV